MDFSVCWSINMAPPFTPVFYKPSSVGGAILFRCCEYLILVFSNASFLSTPQHIKWQAFSIGLKLRHLAKWFDAVVEDDFGVLSYTGTCWSVWSMPVFCVLAVNERFGVSPLHNFWKTSEPSETPRVFSKPYILDNFSRSNFGCKDLYVVTRSSTLVKQL